MVLRRLLSSRPSRLLSLLSLVVTAVRAILGGNRRLGALLLGVALLAYRFSPVGIAVSLLYHRYGDRISRRAMNQ